MKFFERDKHSSLVLKKVWEPERDLENFVKTKTVFERNALFHIHIYFKLDSLFYCLDH